MVEQATYRLKLWTGPVFVKQLAEKARKAGLEVTSEGTEHLYVEIDAIDTIDARIKVEDAWQQEHGFTLQFSMDITNVREVQA